MLVIVHNLALSQSWYFLYPDIDIPIHIIGGFSIGLLTYAIMVKGITSNHGNYVNSSQFWDLYVIVFGTLLVSIIWELLELLFYLTNDAGLSQETLSDIIFGVVGSFIAWQFIQLLPADRDLDADKKIPHQRGEGGRGN